MYHIYKAVWINLWHYFEQYGFYFFGQYGRRWLFWFYMKLQLFFFWQTRCKQYLIKNCLNINSLAWISSGKECIYIIYTQKVEQKFGIRQETKTTFHLISKLIFLFHFYPYSLYILYLNTFAGKENIDLSLMK